jgi:hypothetical protein
MPFEWSHSEFQFASSRDWKHIETTDESQLQLFCPETQTAVTLSMEAYQVPPEKFEKLARFLLETRKKSYIEGVKHLSGAATDVQVSYDYEIARPHSSGDGYEIAYEALHHGRSFLGYLGYVTSRKVVNLFVDTRVSFAAGRRDMYREVLAGFAIALP